MYTVGPCFRSADGFPLSMPRDTFTILVVDDLNNKKIGVFY